MNKLQVDEVNHNWEPCLGLEIAYPIATVLSIQVNERLGQLPYYQFGSCDPGKQDIEKRSR